MPAIEESTLGEPLSREQVLDELEFLATVEHALVVEYLTVCCALGHDLPTQEGGPTTEQGTMAAGAAFSLAQREMNHLKGINLALVAAGRSTQLERAASISSDSVAEIALGPPGPAQLDRLLEREQTIASAVDERYARLQPAVDAVFEEEVLPALRAVIVEDGQEHAEAVTTLRDPLGDLAAADFLRVTRRAPNDTFEQRLLDISDRAYGLIVAALREQFAPSEFFTGAFRDFAVSAMFGLDEINRALVQRGLLPPFTLI